MKKLYRSEENRKIAGVCGGIGEYFDIDPSILRLIWLVLIFFGGFGIIAYIIAFVIIPRRSELTSDSEKQNTSAGSVKPRSNYNARVFWGIVLILLGIFFGMKQFWCFDHIFYQIAHYLWKYFIPAILIAIGIFIIIQGDKKDKTDNK